MFKKRSDWGSNGGLLAAPTALFGLLFLLIPLGMLVGMSVLTRGEISSEAELPLTLTNYQAIFKDPIFSILVRSTRIALTTTLICFLVGYPLAFFIGTRRRNWVKQTALFLVILPFWTNFLVRTYAWQLILGRRGLLNEVLVNQLGILDEPLSLLGTETAVMLGLVYGYLPFMVLPIYAVVERFPFSLVSAGHDLGANDWDVFWGVIFPLTLPGIVVGWILVFIPSIGAFITPNLLGGVEGFMIGNYINSQFNEAGGSWTVGAASSIAMMLLVSLALLAYGVLGTGQAFPSNRVTRAISSFFNLIFAPYHWVTYQIRLRTASSGDSVSALVLWRDRLVLVVSQIGMILISGLGILFLWLPIAVLIIFSFNDSRRFTGKWEGFTTDWYSQVFDGISGQGSDFSTEQLMDSLQTSLQVSLTTLVIAVILGTMFALALARGHFWGKRSLEALLYIPITIPNITMGIALLIFFRWLILNAESAFNANYSTQSWMVVVAHIAYHLSYVAIVVRARLANMDAHLEEAASDLGLNAWETFWAVTYPLILPGIVAGGLLAFTLSLDDFVITFFVSGGTTTTLPVYVWSLIKSGISPQINVVSTLMIVASAVLIAFSLALQARQIRQGGQD